MERILVRLGEYDMSRTTDGTHEDVSVDHVVKHDTFDFVNMINDIALIHLVHDVDFTGKTFYFSKILKVLLRYLSFACAFIAIVPIQ